MEFDYNLKLILVGDSDVGKSTFFKKINNLDYDNCEATIGLDFKIFWRTFNNKRLKINLWDTAGQERFRSIINRYFENICGIILIFDLNKEKTFKSVENWIYDLKKFNKCEHEHPILLIGNKNDLECNIDKEIIANLVSKYQLIYFETSIKNMNIDYLLDILIVNIDDKIIKNNFECDGCLNKSFENNNIKIRSKEMITRMKCCK